MTQPANRRLVTEATLRTGVEEALSAPGPAAVLNAAIVQATATYNVADFGAVGDGTTDDAAALQAALDAAVGGGQVLVPPGTYLIKSKLSIGMKTRLTLAPGATVKRGAAGVTIMLETALDGTTGGYDAATDVVIEGGVWDGNSSIAGNVCCFAFCHTRNLLVQNTTLTNLPGKWHAAEVNATEYATFRNVEFSDMQATDATELVQIDMANATGWTGAGPYDDTPCRDITFEGCRFLDSPHGAGLGTHFSKTGISHDRITVIGCTFQGLAIGIKHLHWNDLRVSACTFVDVGSGITNLSPETGNALAGFSVTGCLFDNTDRTPAVNDECAVRFTGRSLSERTLREIVISGNTIRRAGRWGIRVDQTQGAQIVGNVLEGIGTLPTTSTDRAAISVLRSLNVTVSGNHSSGVNPTSAGGDAQDICVGVTSTVTDTQNVTVTGNNIAKIRVGGATNVVVTGNNITGGGPTLTSPLAGVRVFGNQGQVTEAHGTATIPGGSASVTVTHGISGTPTSIVLGKRASEDVWVSTRGSTTFSIQRTGTTGDLVVDWSALRTF